MTPEEQNFTAAFNRNRPTLALFSKCSTKDELHIVRDAFYLGMASQICKQEYESIRESLITDPSSFDAIASSINTDKGLEKSKSRKVLIALSLHSKTYNTFRSSRNGCSCITQLA
jgi:hypothetical protein